VQGSAEREKLALRTRRLLPKPGMLTLTSFSVALRAAPRDVARKSGLRQGRSKGQPRWGGNGHVPVATPTSGDKPGEAPQPLDNLRESQFVVVTFPSSGHLRHCIQALLSLGFS
jgi:hypothetical protein